MNQNQQLRAFIDKLLQIPFLLPNPDTYWNSKETPSEIKEIKYHDPGIEKYLNPGYYAYKDTNRIHYYSGVEDCSVFIAESRGGDNLNNWGSNFDEFDEVSSLLINEYEAVRSELIKILGSPTYIEDQFAPEKIRNREKNDWKRRDIPLERQMVGWFGTLRLTYWIIENRVIYLDLNWMDREEPIALVLGCRPIRESKNF